MSHTQPPNLYHEDRQDRLIREMEHDTYKTRQKLPEPTACPECGALFHEGRWQWGEVPPGAHRETCPACNRIRDKCPAGFLSLSGDFFAAHRDEILRLVHNIEQREKNEHALKRLMAVEEQDGGVLMTFTNPQLARAAGQAIQHAYKGDLDFAYQEDEYLLRVAWKR
jgi:NMD protein affecting ribosome stability and mRNA decay